MSGVAAIINLDGAPVARGAIEKMTRAMARRGPDGVAHWVEGSLALGHCMFRTTPESLQEAQPLFDEARNCVLVMDGRLDNWEELRHALLSRRVALRDRSDAELVLKAYLAWGKGCLSRIDGDFAFVIYDFRRHEAFCARDCMGNKPLYYCWRGRRLIVASDLSAVLAALDPPPAPNWGMVAEYLAGEWLSIDETIWRGVMRLVAAHRLHADAEGLRIERYWSPPLDRMLRYRRDEDYFEHYREVFADCVRRSARSHLPVACEVSGGLDSSAVFCMAEHLRKSGRLPAPALKGYALAFEAEGDDDELTYIRAVRDRLGLAIHESAPTIHALSWFEERAREEQDFPGFPNGAMFAEMRRAMADAGSRVALNGEGGDEWLGGSLLHYAEDLAVGAWRGLYESFRADAAAFGLRRSSYWLLRHGLFHLLPSPLKNAARALGRPSRADVHSGAYWLTDEMRRLLDERRRAPPPRGAGEPLREGQRALLARLEDPFAAYMKERSDRAGALYDVESRAPMHRRAFVEFALAAPDRMRLRGGVNKYLHIRALAELLPPMVVRRRGKADFGFVFCHYLDDMRDLLVEDVPRQRGRLIVPEGVARLYQAYRERGPTGSPYWELWGLFGVYCLPADPFGRVDASIRGASSHGRQT